MTSLRIALFVLEALPNARTVRRFVADHRGDVVFVGLSNAERPGSGGMVGQLRRHLARSGPRFVPYLAINFGLPDVLAMAAPVTQAVAGARDSVEATPLRRLCKQLAIPSMRIDAVNGPEVHAALKAARPDLIVTFHFDQILAETTIGLARLGGVNIHPALLPHHRGPVPTIHALAEADRAFGVTLHRLAATIDAGAILAQRAVALPEDVTATRAAMVLHEAGRPLLDDLLRNVAATGALPEGDIPPILPYAPFPTRALLADMARRGLRLTDAGDLAAALTLSARG